MNINKDIFHKDDGTHRLQQLNRQRKLWIEEPSDACDSLLNKVAKTAIETDNKLSHVTVADVLGSVKVECKYNNEIIRCENNEDLPNRDVADLSEEWFTHPLVNCHVKKHITNSDTEVMVDDISRNKVFLKQPAMTSADNENSSAYWDHVRTVRRPNAIPEPMFYDNPFDPRLKHPFGRTQLPQERLPPLQSENCNLFLTVTAPSDLLEQHTNAYRQHLIQLKQQAVVPLFLPAHPDRDPPAQQHQQLSNEELMSLAGIDIREKTDQSKQEMDELLKKLFSEKVRSLWRTPSLESEPVTAHRQKLAPVSRPHPIKWSMQDVDHEDEGGQVFSQPLSLIKDNQTDDVKHIMRHTYEACESPGESSSRVVLAPRWLSSVLDSPDSAMTARSGWDDSDLLLTSSARLTSGPPVRRSYSDPHLNTGCPGVEPETTRVSDSALAFNSGTPSKISPPPDHPHMLPYFPSLHPAEGSDLGMEILMSLAASNSRRADDESLVNPYLAWNDDLTGHPNAAQNHLTDSQILVGNQEPSSWKPVTNAWSNAVPMEEALAVLSGYSGGGEDKMALTDAEPSSPESLKTYASKQLNLCAQSKPTGNSPAPTYAQIATCQKASQNAGSSYDGESRRCTANLSLCPSSDESHSMRTVASLTNRSNYQTHTHFDDNYQTSQAWSGLNAVSTAGLRHPNYYECRTQFYQTDHLSIEKDSSAQYASNLTANNGTALVASVHNGKALQASAAVPSRNHLQVAPPTFAARLYGSQTEGMSTTAVSNGSYVTQQNSVQAVHRTMTGLMPNSTAYAPQGMSNTMSNAICADDLERFGNMWSSVKTTVMPANRSSAPSVRECRPSTYPYTQGNTANFTQPMNTGHYPMNYSWNMMSTGPPPYQHATFKSDAKHLASTTNFNTPIVNTDLMHNRNSTNNKGNQTQSATLRRQPMAQHYQPVPAKDVTQLLHNIMNAGSRENNQIRPPQLMPSTYRTPVAFPPNIPDPRINDLMMTSNVFSERAGHYDPGARFPSYHAPLSSRHQGHGSSWPSQVTPPQQAARLLPHQNHTLLHRPNGRNQAHGPSMTSRGPGFQSG